jgi:hypothetical protein
VFENRVLKRIFAPRRGEVMGGWRMLHSGEPSLSFLALILKALKSLTTAVL